MLLFMVAIYLYFTIFFRDTLLKCQVLYLLPLKKNSIKTLFVFFLKGNKRLVSECLWVFTLQRNIFLPLFILKLLSIYGHYITMCILNCYKNPLFTQVCALMISQFDIYIEYILILIHMNICVYRRYRSY